MHLIVLENEPSSLRGGQELNLFEICSSLSQRGHKITLIYQKQGNLIEQYRVFCECILKVNSYGFDRRKLTEVLQFLPSIANLWKVPVTKNSVIFSNEYNYIFWGYILSYLRKIPLVCYLQLPPPNEFNHQKRIGLNGVKQFIAVSNQTNLDWSKLGFKKDKIDVVYNGTNLQKFKPPENFSTLREEWNMCENIKVISYVGRLDRPKGLETLIKAFALLLESGMSARLLIAGNPTYHLAPDGKECPIKGEEYKQSLKQLSTNLGIENYVNFLGHVANTTSLYQVSDVTVLPSLWSEPFPRAIIESMACGTPVVASRTGGIPENLTEEFQRGLFEPGNERNLLEALQQIINWRERDPELGKRCREHVLGKFSLDKLVDGIEKALLNVSERR